MTEQNAPIIILAETEEPARRLVQLAVDHEVDYSEFASELVTATMTQNGVKVRRMSSQKKQKEFYLDADAMDALVSAWTKFSDDQAAKVRAEDERLARIVAEAYAIAQQYPAVKIEELAQNYWRVSCPESGWIAAYPALNAESLLRDVKNAQADYLRLLPAIKARKWAVMQHEKLRETLTRGPQGN